MDFERNNDMIYTNNFSLGEPALPFRDLDTTESTNTYIGTTHDLWKPYSKFDSFPTGPVNLGVPMMNVNNMNCNNNFDGTLEADNCSYESSSMFDSDMESISDVDLTEGSDDVIESDNYDHTEKVSEHESRFRDDTERGRGEHTLHDTQYNYCQDTEESIIQSIITDDDLAAGYGAPIWAQQRARTDTTELGQDQRDFKFKFPLKAKPGLPEVGGLLLQEKTTGTSESTSWVSSWNKVVVHHCNNRCACMADKASMYYGECQTQNSF